MGFKLPGSAHSNHKLFKLFPMDMLDVSLKEEKVFPFILI